MPLTATIEQLFISGLSQGLGNDSDAALVKTYLPESPNMVHEQSGKTSASSPQASTGRGSDCKISKIGFVGLGAMGRGMATSLVRAGFPVQGYDVYPPAVEAFTGTGSNALPARSPEEAIHGSDVVLLMVQNAAQIDDILFGSSRCAYALADGAVVIVSSTVPPEYVRTLSLRLNELGKGVQLVDAPVSGGVARAANGTLTVSFPAIVRQAKP